jgi:sugar (pentulose or hexulose) kinase
MNSVPVIAIFDIGKTNKKILLFDEQYNNVLEESIQLQETVDEDGDPCEDLALLTEWVKNTFERMIQLPNFQIKAINFSAYGASFVHIMEQGKQLLPLYNYLKPFPPLLEDEFYTNYGGKSTIEKVTASPACGNLNSGLQLYRIKKQQPSVFKNIRRSLHLPQYLSFLITNREFSDITSIGCHTALWNFEKGSYHQWVIDEEIDKKLAPVEKGDKTVEVFYHNKKIIAGIGLHDSSAALIPYLTNFIEPFVLISTGTWCISLNPFNNAPLTEEELYSDCLSYIQYQGLPVKANRLFAGYEHEQQVKNLSLHFSKPADYYKQISYDEAIVKKLTAGRWVQQQGQAAEVRVSTDHSNQIATTKLGNRKSVSTDAKQFAALQPATFNSYKEAYHQLMINIVERQVASTTSILKGITVKQIFVDGGFSKNPIYMNLLAQAFPLQQVFAASMAQATAMGAALAIHKHWNSQPIPGDIIALKMYSVPKLQ